MARIERTVTSVSWIPSDSIPGLLKLPFSRGVMHYDPPPPLDLTDIDGIRERGEFRFANQLSVAIDVDGGRITGAGYLGGGTLMGRTPITAGPLRIMLPTIRHSAIQWEPVISDAEATFVQTAGGRPGFSFARPTWRWPFLVTKPFSIWTTIKLTVAADGSCTQSLIGASPFPRHWLYDEDGQLAAKSALTRLQVWTQTVFGTHTPWGGEDQVPAVADAETDLERVLADRIMQGEESPDVRTLRAGGYLFRQGEATTELALILDGTFEVAVDGTVVGTVGPGTVVGERAGIEEGRRTADVYATTDARVALVPSDRIDTSHLSDLAVGHHREGTSGPSLDE